MKLVRIPDSDYVDCQTPTCKGIKAFKTTSSVVSGPMGPMGGWVKSKQWMLAEIPVNILHGFQQFVHMLIRIFYILLTQKNN